MHAIARRISARFAGRRDRRRRRGSTDDDDDDDNENSYERIEIRMTNSAPHPNFTPCNIRLGMHGSVYHNRDSSESWDEDSEVSTKNPSFLYNSARSWAWAALAHRCETHPWEASADNVNQDGDTALHWAVFGNPPLYVVEALLKACPDLVNVANACKQLPLHVACCYRSPSEVLEALIEANPETLGYRNKLGLYPLHILCDRGCTMESLDVMLRYPQAIKTITEKDYMYDRTPLYILNQRKNLWAFGEQTKGLRKLRHEQRDAIQFGNWADNDERRLQNEVDKARQSDFWRKAKSLLLAEYRQQCRLPINDDCGTVRACLELKNCPPSLREYAILAYSEELSVPDEQGKLPLHHVCSSGSDRKEDQWLLVEVLNAYPEAARIHDKNGMLPLEIFVDAFSKCGRTDALMRLILANPIAVDNLRIDIHLYPSILEVICGDKNSRSGVFELIKASPGLFAGFANHQPYQVKYS
jgi:hypothetical protein